MTKRLHIIDHVEAGGAQKVVEAFLDTDIVFALRQGKYISINKHKNLIIHSSKAKYSFSPIQHIKKLIKENKIKTIVSHLPRSNFFATTLKKQHPSLQLIHFEHGDVYEHRPVIQYLIRKSLKHSDIVLAVSEETKRKLISLYPKAKKKIHVLYNFVGEEFFGIEKTKTDSKKIQLGFAARLIKRKGWESMLEAISMLDKDKYQLHIAGTGVDEKAFLERITSLGLKDNIDFYAYIKDMPSFYAKLDVLVIPSLWEPMGIIALEAMASNCLIVATDVPGMNELLNNKKNALLFAANDTTTMANVINWVIENPKKAEEIKKQAVLDVEDYRKDKFMTKFESFLA